MRRWRLALFLLGNFLFLSSLDGKDCGRLGIAFCFSSMPRRASRLHSIIVPVLIDVRNNVTSFFYNGDDAWNLRFWFHITGSCAKLPRREVRPHIVIPAIRSERLKQPGKETHGVVAILHRRQILVVKHTCCKQELVLNAASWWTRNERERKEYYSWQEWNVLWSERENVTSETATRPLKLSCASY